MRGTGILVLCVLAAAPAAAQKVEIDYAAEFDFEPVETFAYVETDDSDRDDRRQQTGARTRAEDPGDQQDRPRPSQPGPVVTRHAQRRGV